MADWDAELDSEDFCSKLGMLMRGPAKSLMPEHLKQRQDFRGCFCY